ncbi:DUF805 domain-containing protein [Shewanella sp.]|nr:DUF805 domain-containing protein [Shewanella sp.]
MQLSALFCLNGRDNGQRFSVISGLTFFVLFLACIEIGATATLYIPGILLLPILALTSYRRLRDSGKPLRLMGLSIIPFLLVLFTLVQIDSAIMLIILTLLSALAVGYLSILPAATRTNYIQGYSGPVNLTNKSTAPQMRTRVEPTLSVKQYGDASQPRASDKPTQQIMTPESPQPASHQTGKQSEVLTGITSWLRANPKRMLTVMFSLLGIVLLMSVWSLLMHRDVPSDLQQAQNKTQAVKASSDRVSTTLPDGVSLALENDVLIVRWLGETGSATTLWSLATGVGDKSCAILKFNNGTEYRPIEVNLLADTGTEARFSPLDTQAIVADMARRSHVNLCGYRFSLKGSQAAINKVSAFARYL